jgi:hypothetical protein
MLNLETALFLPKARMFYTGPIVGRLLGKGCAEKKSFQI